MFLGVDTGGTFTDFVHISAGGMRVHKVLSTPQDPSLAIEQGIKELGLEASKLHLIHGSTVATNAILERKGVRTLFVTNADCEDLLTIGRQTRPELYNLCAGQPRAWIAPQDCIGIHGRIGALAEVVEELNEADLQALTDRLATNDYESVAVCMLFSFLNPAHEAQLSQLLPETLFQSVSHRLLAEYGEYERAATTFLNAYVGPLVERYLHRLQHTLSPKHLYVMHSAGGVMAADAAASQAVRLVLSGPAGGLVAATAVGKQLGEKKLLAFDMGGTSTDVALIDHQPGMTTEGSIAGIPVALPMLDIHTIGAGGGSLAWVDAAGLPQVGPASAGARPGPVCYGLGGHQVTVTDANLLLGRIPKDARLAGTMSLDIDACRKQFDQLAETLGLSAMDTAKAVLDIAEEHMAGALRVVSVQRGHDPADFALLCFGGAGGLHACALAEKLAMRRVIVPVASGAFSALGMLAGRQQSEFSRSRVISLSGSDAMTGLADCFEDLVAEANRQMPGLTLAFEKRVDMRYKGQGFHLIIPLPDRPDGGMIVAEELEKAFHQAHLQAYGHVLDRPVEIITCRLSAFVSRPSLAWPEMSAGAPATPCAYSEIYQHGDVPIYQREALHVGQCLTGPALVSESIATLWLPPAWSLQLSENGHFLLERC